MKQQPGLSPHLVGLAAAWCAVVAGGFALLWAHAYTPGPTAAPTGMWPIGIPRQASQPTIVMVLHPQCSCSTASVGELERVLARADREVQVQVIFSGGDAQADPADSALWTAARALHGATIVIDRDAVEAARFGAYVSGQTFLFDRDGRLLFSGGITESRGHAGDNDGATALLEALKTGQSPLAHTPVFGCLLGKVTT